MSDILQISNHGPLTTLAKHGVGTVWDEKNGKPHKCLERPAYCQIVPRLPWLKRIDP